MQGPQVAFLTPADAPRWKRWLLLSPFMRVFWFVAMVLVFVMGVKEAFALLGFELYATTKLQFALGMLALEALPVGLAYLMLVRMIERRDPLELAPRSLLTYGSAGLLTGLVLFSSVVGILWLVGSYHVTGTNAHPDWLPEVLLAGLTAGFAEEIICRGVLFRITEEGLGTWVALLVSAAFFGIAHISNPGATWWSSAAIAIEAGLLLGMLYHVTRSLWVCMGLHAAWNVAQGTLYGIPVSGTRAEGFLVSTRSGPDWLSGGVFGAEASVVALSVCTLCTLAMLVVALRRGTFVPPLAARLHAIPQATGWDRLDVIR